MQHDDVKREELWLLVTKYAPALVMLGSLVALGASLTLSLAIAFLFAALGFLALYKHVRLTIAALAIVATIIWSLASSDTKQSALGMFGITYNAVGQ
jgi:hypothetical protein